MWATDVDLFAKTDIYVHATWYTDGIMWYNSLYQIENFI